MISNLVIFFINFYQRRISPFLRPSCVFYPSCSTYAKESIKKYGFLFSLGSVLGRVFSCHPFSSRFKKSFWDPVS